MRYRSKQFSDYEIASFGIMQETDRTVIAFIVRMTVYASKGETHRNRIVGDNAWKTCHIDVRESRRIASGRTDSAYGVISFPNTHGRSPNL